MLRIFVFGQSRTPSTSQWPRPSVHTLRVGPTKSTVIMNTSAGIIKAVMNNAVIKPIKDKGQHGHIINVIMDTTDISNLRNWQLSTPLLHCYDIMAQFWAGRWTTCPSPGG
jgi:hypothetical protein